MDVGLVFWSGQDQLTLHVTIGFKALGISVPFTDKCLFTFGPGKEVVVTRQLSDFGSGQDPLTRDGGKTL